ncbi:MAG: helix-turn-helix domain-containing protein [Pirellulales bacterium]|nr:helix-turn-helix domain-containing protein [Pirellulales bacterium]
MSIATTTEGLSPALLTLREAAALCGVSTRTLWAWARDGLSPPPLKIGRGVVRYSRRAFEEWVAAGCPQCNREGDGE